jgi:hypothetical protein
MLKGLISGCEHPTASTSIRPVTPVMLLFKRKFLDAIRRGEKTQTIRLWKHRHMRAGQRSYIPGIGPIRITSIEVVSIDDLTDADAVPDGFPTAAALRDELRTIYGDRLADGYQAFRIVFEPQAE